MSHKSQWNAHAKCPNSIFSPGIQVAEARFKFNYQAHALAMKSNPNHLAVLLWLVLITAVYLPSAFAAPGDVNVGFNPNVNGEVLSVAVQPDGKIIVGGTFTTVGGLTRNRLARLNADGSLDFGFNPNVSSTVNCTAIQPDGKILVGGNYTSIGGTTRRNIARLHSDGTLDIAFNPNADSIVNSIAVQQDSKIVIAGWFNNVGGVTRNECARLNADGTVDPAFNPDANQAIFACVTQADGKTLIGGQFSTLGGISRNGMGRYNTDGTVDSTFNRTTTGYVDCIAVQPDGKIIIGVGINGYVFRLNANGSADSSFLGNANGSVSSAVIQSDGKIVIGGQFTIVGGVARNRIARLNANGTLDTSFNPNANSNSRCIAIQPDGKILVGGVFTSVGGVVNNYLVRIDNDAVSQSLTATSASRIEWLRSGSSPETLQVDFATSINAGVSWSSLGSATRISGGWELTGLSLPTSGLIRAQGYISGGYHGGSEGLLETVGAFPSAPEIEIEQPISTNLLNGGNRSLGVAPVGGSISSTFGSSGKLSHKSWSVGCIEGSRPCLPTGKRVAKCWPAHET